MELFPQDWFKAFASIPNLILALAFQMNYFPIYKGMRNANDKRMGQATLTAVSVCSTLYLVFGIMGYHLVYIMEQSDVKPNFLTSLSYGTVNNVMYFIFNIGILLSVFFSFSVIFFGCRNNFISLIRIWFEKD
jgi:amino acid permease